MRDRIIRHQDRPYWVVAGALMLMMAAAVGVSADDAIEEALALELGHMIDVLAQREDLPPRDQAYLYFLQAVYGHAPSARERAEERYRQLALPESQAFQGSLDILQARDLRRRGTWSGLLYVLTERRFVVQGIEELDTAVTTYPDNVDIRIVRAITYLQLPSIFGKFQVGLQDMKLVLEWTQKGTVSVPKEDRLFRDQASLYYYAGRYFLKTGQTDAAQAMFVHSIQSSARSPFAHAADRRVLAIRAAS